jgi:hypothetical protein
MIERGEKPQGGRHDYSWLIFECSHEGAPMIDWLHHDGGRP